MRKITVTALKWLRRDINVYCDQVTDVGCVGQSSVIRCQIRQVYSKLGKVASVHVSFDHAKQLKRRRRSGQLHTASMYGKQEGTFSLFYTREKKL